MAADFWVFNKNGPQKSCSCSALIAFNEILPLERRRVGGGRLELFFFAAKEKYLQEIKNENTPDLNAAFRLQPDRKRSADVVTNPSKNTPKVTSNGKVT